MSEEARKRLVKQIREQWTPEVVKAATEEFEAAKIEEAADKLHRIFTMFNWEWSGRQYPAGVPTKEIFIKELTKRIKDLRSTKEGGSIGGGRINVICNLTDEGDEILDFDITLNIGGFPVEYEDMHAMNWKEGQKAKAIRKAAANAEWGRQFGGPIK